MGGNGVGTREEGPEDSPLARVLNWATAKAVLEAGVVVVVVWPWGLPLAGFFSI